MKYTQSEKMEIIRMVEDSPFSVKHTLLEIGVSRSTFYEWYKRYQEEGFEGLGSRNKCPRQVWNTIPEWERQRVVEVAREFPEKSCREVACHITDKLGIFISESSVYRILKSYDLVTSPVYTVVSAKDRFEHPTTRVNQLWQPADKYFGRDQKILQNRIKVKNQTIRKRRKINRLIMMENLPNEIQ